MSLETLDRDVEPLDDFILGILGNPKLEEKLYPAKKFLDSEGDFWSICGLAQEAKEIKDFAGITESPRQIDKHIYEDPVEEAVWQIYMVCLSGPLEDAIKEREPATGRAVSISSVTDILEGCVTPGAICTANPDDKQKKPNQLKKLRGKIGQRELDKLRKVDLREYILPETFFGVAWIGHKKCLQRQRNKRRDSSSGQQASRPPYDDPEAMDAYFRRIRHLDDDILEECVDPHASSLLISNTIGTGPLHLMNRIESIVLLACELENFSPRSSKEDFVRNSREALAEIYIYDGIVAEEFKLDTEAEVRATLVERASIDQEFSRDEAIESILALHTAYFDMRNLLLNRPTNSDIAHKIKVMSNKGRRTEKRAGRNLLLFEKKFETFMRKQKRSHIKSKVKKAQSTAIAPLAYYVYTGNMVRVLMHDFGGHTLTMLNLLAQLDLQEHQESGELVSYVKRFLDGDDIFSQLIGAVKRIERTEDEHGRDEITVLQYLDLFTEDRRRATDKLKCYTNETFTNLWARAADAGWVDVLYEHIDNVEDLVGGSNDHLERLTREESGSLVLLLGNSSIKKDFTRGKLKVDDIELLAEVYQLDMGMLDVVYRQCSADDSDAIRGLVRLMRGTGQDYKELRLNERTKKYLSTLKESDFQELEAIALVVQEFKAVDEALALEVTPFTGSLEDMADKKKFALWYKDNREVVARDVKDTKKAQEHMGDLKSITLRKKVVELGRMYNGTFCRDYLGPLVSSGTLVYERMADISLALSNAPGLLRRRELYLSLQLMAHTSSEESWKAFKEEVSGEKNGENPLKAKLQEMRKYVTSERQLAARMEAGDQVYVAAYEAVKGTPDEALLDTLIGLQEELSQEPGLTTTLYQRLAAGHVGVVRAIAEQIGLGMTLSEAGELVEWYETDDNIDELSQKDLLEMGINLKKHYEEILVEEPEPTPVPFDYAPFRNRVEREGYNPEIVQTLIEKGFQLFGSGRFVGEGYTQGRHVIESTRNCVPGNLKNYVGKTVDNIMHWLIKENVVQHIERKGRKPKDGCVSINPHILEIQDEALRDYMSHVFTHQVHLRKSA